MTQRDVLVVLREELARARTVLLETELTDADLAAAAQKLTASADALEVRIRAQFDQLLLDKAARTFRAAATDLDRLLEVRIGRRRQSPTVQRVLRRVVVHAREISKRSTGDVADAIEALSSADAWTGPTLDALVGLVDTFELLARRRLGDAAHDGQIASLVDRAVSAAAVTCLHALKEHPTVIRDRFQLDKALVAPTMHVEERLASWFRLDDDGRSRLRRAVALFTRRLLDRATR